MFGFHPDESVVMMLLGPGPHPMFARIDLPRSAEQADAVSEEFARAAVVNDGVRFALVAYTDDEDAAFRACLHVASDLSALGYELLFALRADGRRWFRILPGPEDLEGVAYDVDSHPITAAGVMQGQVTLGSRDDLAQSLLPIDPDLVDAVAEAHAAMPRLVGEHLAGEARWLDDWTMTHVRAGGTADDVQAEELARVVRDLAERELHEVASVSMSRDNAPAHVRLWTDVVVRCPLDLLAPAAALLSLAAWLEGHGALAWCAVDRALQSDPDCRLARLVSQVLEAAVPPSSWEPGDRRLVSLLRE